MKLNRIILPLMVGALTWSSCDDQIMEWKESDGSVTASDIPLALKEKIANYDYIKAYAAQYAPNMTIGLGLGADLYINDAAYKAVADANFQMFTTGNAMKHSAVVKNNGDLDFTTIDAFLNAVPTDIKVYGHNFLWHTQQRQTYLKSLIAPEVIIEVDDDDVCENIVGNFGFEGGNAEGWTGLWGKYTYAVEQPGYDSNYALHFTMTNETKDNYDCQLFWPTGMLETGVTYAYSFWVKSDAGLEVQFIGQNAAYDGIYKEKFTAPSDWIRCTGEFTYTESDKKDIERVGIQFGGTPGSNLWVDDFKFGKKIEEKMINIIDDGKFEDGTLGSWFGWGNGSTRSISEKGEGYNSDYCMIMVNPSDGDSWSAQTAHSFPEELTVGKTYMYSVMVKATVINPDFTLQVQDSNGGNGEGYVSGETVVDQWVPIEGEFICKNEGMARLCINYGKVGGTYYIDNFKFGEKKETAEVKNTLRATTRAGGITYKFKTAEEKKTALLGAMEAWIKGMLEHPGMDRVKEWDVINEPIADNNQWRGIDGNFMSNGDDAPDTAPVEDPASGLSLNWASDHFYWGYYIGKEYAVKAFEYARKYAPADTKLYVNDYNLETNPSKLAALIDFVKYIEDNGQVVDGIGTQMHVQGASITRAQIDAMFKAMAATGKLIRVTELDVALGTSSPSAEQLATQANVYQMIFESFKENVPEAQQSGITIWTLSDNAAEHEYWLSGDAPNLFDANYGRKHAYKGVCDGIAGKDISEDFSGDDWKNAYETEEEETPAE
ncbi:endo-1,4-beta-xylanase [uncultured Bacteroides sp.]|mgnify:FL=1|uniref:endo-1,4-beta-xylanase n=1 Tax=uncultured Bacteroides sp. TaxID=162156 RepID=UPI0025E0C14F|nr:endo-1,4-beta-xylanase [uncultured Bacteroides sp.]